MARLKRLIIPILSLINSPIAFAGIWKTALEGQVVRSSSQEVESEAFFQELEVALERGTVEISDENEIEFRSDLYTILKHLNRSEIQSTTPLIQIRNGKAHLMDMEKMEDMIEVSKMTWTSMNEL